MIALAENFNQFSGSCRYVLNSREDLSFQRDNAVDFVLTHIALQHRRPEFSKRYVCEFFRVMRAGGIAVLQIPSHREVPAGCSQINEPLPTEAFKAHIEGREFSGELKAGASLDVLVSVQNCSPVLWPAFGSNDSEQRYFVHLGNHWVDSSRDVVIVDDGRSALPRDLAPNGVTELLLRIAAPSQPGEYILELDMVQEGVAWFAQRGSTTWRSRVKVTKATEYETNDAIDGRGGRMEMHGVPRD